MASATLPRLALLCLCTLACATPSRADPASWALVRSEPGMGYFLDKGSVRMQGAYLSYWILVSFDYDPRFDGTVPFRSARLLRYAHCGTREQDTKSFFQYHAPMGRGEPAWAVTLDDATLRLEPVEPGSVGAQILDLACSLEESNRPPR